MVALKRVSEPTAEHKAFRADVIALLKKHADHLQAVEMLTLSAHIVGQIIAMQNQRKVSGEAALEIVMANIQQGNKEVLEGLMGPVAGSS